MTPLPVHLSVTSAGAVTGIAPTAVTLTVEPDVTHVPPPPAWLPSMKSPQLRLSSLPPVLWALTLAKTTQSPATATLPVASGSRS